MKKILLICSMLSLISETPCNELPARLIGCWPDALNHQTFPIEFYLSSKLNGTKRFQSNAILERFDIHPQRRTILVVHGFHSSSRDALIRNLRRKFHAWNDVNFIVVNWEQGCSNPLLYQYAVVNTEFVAWRIRNFFANLFNYWEYQKNVPRKEWKPLHFIGFSLGAHIAGQCAALLKREDNVLVHRVTGLDPAEPCFEDDGNPLRLNRTNARFVDVIHTDGARTRNAAFGLLQPIGHADFYVNGGSEQPGCENNFKPKRNINFASLLNHSKNNGTCHHVRSMTLFSESIVQATANQCKFWAHPWRLNTNLEETNRILQNQCDDDRCTEMGIYAELYRYEKENVFYVPTTGKSPFCNV